MSEDRLELEQELLLTSTKAKMINKYIDELEENEILTKQWLKTTQELDKYKNIVDELEQHLEAMIRIYENEYKSIEDAEHYRSILNKLKELKGSDN